METSRVLWADLRLNRDAAGFQEYLRAHWTVFCLNDADEIVRELRRNAPVLLCFEYDYPDPYSLSVLRQARCLSPSTPIIMLTEQHSEALAIWALRMHVTDYFVKPLPPEDLISSAENLLNQTALPGEVQRQPGQKSALPTHPVPMEVRVRARQKRRTVLAHSFIETHYHEKIYEQELARLCGMNVSTFSRTFKKEHGMTFKNHLIHHRIGKAKEMLETPNALVTDVAYAVGFHDPSYFTRTFRRLVGTSPSRYQEAHRRCSC